MKCFLSTLLIVALSFSSCKENRVRKKPPVPTSDEALITGCYYITNDSTGLQREVYHSPEHEAYFINPEPILTVANFEEVSITDDEYYPSLSVKLDPLGKMNWSIATEKSKGKRLAFVINNFLVMAPIVNEKISSGAFVVSGSFKKEDLEEFLKAIDFEMYEK